MSKIAALKELLQLAAQADVKQTEPAEPAQDPNAARFNAMQQAPKESAPTRNDNADRAEWERLEKVYGAGLRWGRVVRATAAARTLNNDHSPEGPMRVLQDLYKDRGTVRYLEDLHSRDLTSTTPSEGGYLVPIQMANDVVPLLRNYSVLMQAGARTLPMPNGNLSIPRFATGSTATYVGEMEAPNATGPSFGDVNFTAKKLIAIIPVSNDLLRSASFDVDALVRDDALGAMGEKMDSTGLVSPGTENQPRGLKYLTGKTDVTISGAVSATFVSAFVKALMDAKVPMNVARQWAFIFNPTIWQDLYDETATDEGFLYRDSMDQGRVGRYPYFVSQAITNSSASNNPTDVFFGDFSEFIIARQGTMEISSSNVAAYNNASGTVVAAYSKDATVIRLIDRHDMGLRQAAAVAHSDDVHTS